MGNQYSREMKNTVCDNILKDCPWTAKDIEISDYIFVTNTAPLKRKPARKSPEKTKMEYIQVQQQITDSGHGV